MERGGRTIVAAGPLVLAATFVEGLNETVLDGPFGSARLVVVVSDRLAVLQVSQSC